MRAVAVVLSASIFAFGCGGGGGGGGGGQDAGNPPAAPAALTAIGAVGSIALTWTAAAGATGYQVLRGDRAGSETALATPGSASYSDTAVDAGTTYFYVVRATNASGASGNSNEASAITAPPAPTNLTSTSTGAEIDLSWSASAGATSYVVLRGTTAGGPYASTSYTGTDTHFADQSVSPGTFYYYVVEAANGSGTSPQSAELDALTAPAAPGNLSAVYSGGGVQLSWDGSTGADSYVVFRSLSAGSGYSTIGTVTTPGYSDTSGLTAGTTYYYEVEAKNASGTSALTAAASASTPATAPTGLVATAGNGLVQLSWNAVAGAQSYDVEQSATSGGPYTLAANVSGTVANVSGLANGTLYYFVVRAQDSAGDSANSNEASATPTSNALPIPQGFAAVAGNGQVTLSWSAVTGATHYLISRSDTQGTNYQGIATPVSSPYTDSTVSNFTTYYYVIQAVNGQFTSPDSAEVSATPHGAPAAITNIRAFGQNGGATISFATAANTASVLVLRSTSKSSGFTQIGTSTGQSFADTGLTNEVTYYYELQPKSAQGDLGPLSAPIAVIPALEICVAQPTEYSSVVALDESASGVTDIRRTFADATLLAPVGIASDPIDGEIYVLNAFNSITVYGRDDTGNIAPTRIIAGPHTQLQMPRGIAFDSDTGELFVANESEIDVYARTASGDAAPLRTLATYDDPDPQGRGNNLAIAPNAVAIDKANGELWVAEEQELKVFPLSWSGTTEVAYLRRTNDPGGQPVGLNHIKSLAWDDLNQRIFAGNYDANGLEASPVIQVFDRCGEALDCSGFYLGDAPQYSLRLGNDTEGGPTELHALTFDEINAQVVAATVRSTLPAEIISFSSTDLGDRDESDPHLVTITRAASDNFNHITQSIDGIFAETVGASPRLYVADRSGTAFSIPLAANGTAFALASIVQGPGNFSGNDGFYRFSSIATFGGKLYAADNNNPGISIFPEDSAQSNSTETDDQSYIDADGSLARNGYGLLVDPDGNVLYSDAHSLVDVFDPGGALLTSFTGLNQPSSIAYAAPQDEIFIAELGANSISAYPRGSITASRTFSTSAPRAMAYASATDRLYVVSSAGVVSAYPRTASGSAAASATINPPQSDSTLGAPADAVYRDGFIYVAYSGATSATVFNPFKVVVISEATNAVVRSFSARGGSSAATGLAFCN